MVLVWRSPLAKAAFAVFGVAARMVALPACKFYILGRCPI